jgi:hypothetical protein
MSASTAPQLSKAKCLPRATCKWTFYGGTGKLRGLTGKGTCTGTFEATGAAAFDIVGEYSIAAAQNVGAKTGRDREDSGPFCDHSHQQAVTCRPLGHFTSR